MIDAEQCVLGAMLIDNDVIDDVGDMLCAEDFFLAQHRDIYAAIVAVSAMSDGCDVVTLSQHDKGLDFAYLATLVRNTPTAANVKAYAKIVRDAAIERRLASAANQIGELAGDKAVTTDQKLDKAQELVMTLAETRSRQSGPERVKTILPRVIDVIDTRCEKKSSLIGLSSGWQDLDQKTSGFHPGDLVIVAGRPSMGKTTFAMNLAEYVAIYDKKPALVFSMEMSKEQLIERAVASTARVDYQGLRMGELPENEWAKVTPAFSRLVDSLLFVDDTGALSVHELRSRARRLHREHGLALIVVDYLQLMRGEGENQTQRIGQISSGLKALAKELKVPVVALSQLNRSVEQRQDKRPMMSDLRDSGNIEQDADIILFLYREEVYLPETPNKGTAEVMISKQRNGPTGTIVLTYRGHLMRFDNFSGNYQWGWQKAVVPKQIKTKGFSFDRVGV